MDEKKYVERLIAQQNRLHMWLVLLMVFIMIFFIVSIVMGIGVLWWLDEHDIFSRAFSVVE